MAVPSSSIIASMIPTGGICTLTVVSASGGTINIGRATSGVSGLSAFTTLYSGAPLRIDYGNGVYIDCGDQLPGNVLLPNAQYVYQLTDNTGTYQTAPMTPVSEMELNWQDFTPLMISILQGAINATPLPSGVSFCRVQNAMPINGAPPLPIIAVNPDLVQQAHVPIGQSAINLGGELIQPGQINIFTQPAGFRNVFRFSVLSLNPMERDFYRTLIMSVFRIALISVFQPLGLDWEHNFQASSFQTTTSNDGQIPGFYCCDVIVTLTGTSNVTINTTYGIIASITSDSSGYFGSQTLTQVPTG